MYMNVYIQIMNQFEKYVYRWQKAPKIAPTRVLFFGLCVLVGEEARTLPRPSWFSVNAPSRKPEPTVISNRPDRKLSSCQYRKADFNAQTRFRRVPFFTLFFLLVYFFAFRKKEKRREEEA